MSDKKNIFEKLRNDHDVQRALLDKLLKTQGESDERAKLFLDLKEELSEHAKFEERFFYKPLISSDLTQDKARHSIAEHKEIDDLIEDLEDKEMSSSGWLVKAKELNHKVLHHLEEEEHEVFQLAGKELSENQKTTLAGKYVNAMDENLDRKVK